MIVYDVATKELGTESFPQHTTADLKSGITFIVLFSQEKPLRWKEINTHSHRTAVINWFKKIENKNKYKLMIFDIKGFYSSISKKLLDDSINFAQQHVQIKRRFQYYPSRKKITLLQQGNSVAKDQFFKENGLSLESEWNLKTVNYLDITLHLNTDTYKPYRKPNDETLYIRAKSNHSAGILKQLPISIETRLPNLSSNPEIFHEASKHYQNILN